MRIRRTSHESAKLKQKIIRMARTDSAISIMKDLGISRTYVNQVIREHRIATGEEINGKDKRIAVDIPGSFTRFNILGFCLTCKCAAPNPADRVPQYIGKGAPTCPTCGGTGRYYAELMGRYADIKAAEAANDELCLKCRYHKDYLIAAMSAKLFPRRHEQWKAVRRGMNGEAV